MKRYFATWEVYSQNWALVEKGYHIFNVPDNSDIDVDVWKFLDEMAKVRKIAAQFVTLGSLNPI